MLSILCCVIFVLIPIVGVPLSIIGYIYDKNRNSIVYSLILATILGIFAYNFIPLKSYDLYRHHLVFWQLSDTSIHYFIKNINNFDLELFPMIYTYIISFFHNVNLLQFFIVTLGYTIIFGIIYDYRKKTNISTFAFVIISLISFFGFNALNFISGLWFYIAMLVFLLALYLDYYCNYNKKVCYIMYVGTLFMHTSMFFVFLILLVYKLCGNKLNLRSLFICVLIFIVPVYLLRILSSIFNFSFLNNINWLLNIYFDNNNAMFRFYSGTAFVIEIIKLFLSLLFIFMNRKNEKLKNVNGLIILISVCTIIMMFNSIVMIRFIMLIQLLAIPNLIEYFSKIKRNNLWILIGLVFVMLFFMLFFYNIMSQQNFGDIIRVFTRSLLSMF